MATFRSSLRSFNAAMRRIERENKRREREAARWFKEQQKLDAIEEAKTAAVSWEKYVETIKSLHKDCTDPIDWDEVINTPAPEEPVYDTPHETEIIYKIENFRPSFLDRLLFDRIFSSSEKKKKRLESLREQARQRDHENYQAEINDFKEKKAEWTTLHAMASGVKNKDIGEYKNAIKFFDPFSSLNLLGQRIDIIFHKNIVDMDIHAHSSDVIPDFTLSLTSTGKLSRKSMAKGAFNELYQDHICSSILRAAREIFNYLPVNYTRITAISKLLNTKTGHIEDHPIVSSLIPASTLDRLNLDMIDPSSSMDNFKTNMQFKRNDGFRPTERIALPEQIALT
ncbi:MAG TPA: hypothetical protein VE028_13945 [Nitratidesulfovibrio sp.]|nr:hypothetical protein [Nitratidesulfovibrio sp.]